MLTIVANANKAAIIDLKTGVKSFLTRLVIGALFARFDRHYLAPLIAHGSQ
jgi:hypothetical protein